MSPTPGKPMQTGPNAEYVADNVRRIRKARGITTTQLSALLSQAGHPIAQSSISNIEAGRRRVDVDDLVALAVALDVNPSALLFPLDETGSIELTGGGTVAAVTVWEWADGERPLRLAEDDAEQTEQWGRFLRLARPTSRRQAGMDRVRSELVPALGQLEAAERMGRHADEVSEQAEASGDPHQIARATELLRDANQYSAAVREVLKRFSPQQVHALLDAFSGEDGES